MPGGLPPLSENAGTCISKLNLATVATPARGRMGKKSNDDEAIQIFLDWAGDDVQVRKWQRELNLRKVLGPRPRNFEKAAKGRDSDAMLVQIKGVLPSRIADGAAAIITRISDSKWNTLEGDGDASKPALDGIRSAHKFGAVVDPAGIHGGPELLKALSCLMPPAESKHASFHLGRYEEGDFLAPQNDAAFCAVDAGSKDPAKAGQILKCSRDVGVMLFLSKNRKESGGGILRDLYYQHRADHKGMSYVPEFNSLVAYHVPREYEITPVLSDEPLLSVFGWYLQEGELYDLKPPSLPSALASADRDKPKKMSLKERQKAAKRKLRLKAKRDEKLSTVPEFLQALAVEREDARVNKEFLRADKIREQCQNAGYRFDAGGKLVKIADAAAENAAQDSKTTKNAAPKDLKGLKLKDAKAIADAKNPTGDKKNSSVKKVVAPAAAVEADGPAKKKKESKAQRLQRQAKEAAAGAAGEGGGERGGEGEGSGGEGERGNEVEEDTAHKSGKRGGDSALEGSKQKSKVVLPETEAETTVVESKKVTEVEGKKKKTAVVSKEETETEGKKKKKVAVQETETEAVSSHQADSDITAAKSEKRKRAADGSGDEGEEGEEDGNDAKEGKGKTKRGGKQGGNVAKLLAMSKASKPDATTSANLNPGVDGGVVGEGAANSASAKQLEASKKEPKRPKKAKALRGGHESWVGVGGGTAGEPQDSKKGKGRDVLLARIKNKGWLGGFSAPAPAQM